MDWLESLRKMVPWLQSLPILAKLLVSLIGALFLALLLSLMWMPPPILDPSKNPIVLESYSRMVRLLSKIAVSGHHVSVDGVPVPKKLEGYYKPYAAISIYLKQHPGDIGGAANTVWEHGGVNRTFIDDTQEFETVVSDFVQEFERAKRPSQASKSAE
jgi:hypothetical protein